MYCVTCEQERVGEGACQACGQRLIARDRDLIQADLRHVQLLLRELPAWEIPAEAKAWVRDRYLRSERVLREVLGAPGGELPAVDEAMPRPSEEEAVVPVPSPVAEDEGTQDSLEAAAVAEPPPAILDEPAPPPVAVSQEAALAREEQVIEALPVSRPEPLTPNPAEALLDVPEVRSRARDAVEAVSTWKTVWKPFLYESIGWFLGAFLILAGTFYFVAESWSGMTSLVRALVVFGLSALYSAAFAVGGRWLGTRPGMAGAGRALTLIGAAVAPLAALGLAPVRIESFALFAVLTAGWALATAVFARWPAEAIDPPSARWTQLLAAFATCVLALGPVLADRFAVSTDAVPVLLFVALGWRRAPRKGGARVFTLCAPLYLFALAAVRIHLAHTPPPGVALYAPLGALWTFGVLRLREGEGRIPAPFALGGMALQLALCLAAMFASNVSAAVCFAILAGTAFALADPRAEPAPSEPSAAPASARAAIWARWEWVAVGAGLFAALSAGGEGGPFGEALARAEAPHGPWLPIAWALGYAFAALAFALLPRADEVRRSIRTRAAAGVLLALGALATFSPLVEGRVAPERGLLVLGSLAALGMVAGLLSGRAPWVSAGAVVLLGLPVISLELKIPSLPPALGALGLAALSAWRRPSIRRAPGWVGLALALCAVCLAAIAPTGMGTAVAVACSGVALTWIGVRSGRQAWVALGGAALTFAVAIASPAPLWMVLAGSALALAAASWVEALRGLGWVALLLAPLSVGVHAPQADFQRWGLSPSLAVAAVGYALLSRRWRWVASLAAVLATAALLPSGGSLRPGFRTLLDGLTPLLSVAALAGVSLGASLWTAWRRRDAAAVTAAACALLFSTAGVGWTGLAAGAHLPPALLWIAVVGALAGCRALPAWVAVGWAGLLATGASWSSPLEVWSVATVLTAVAQLDRWPRARSALFGGAKVATVASLLALLACAFCTRTPSVAALVALCVYPLLWMRATRRSLALAAVPILGALFASGAGDLTPFGIALGVTVLTTRGLWHLARVRGWLGVEAAVPRAACWVALVGAAVAGAGGAGDLGTMAPLGLAAVALLAMAGDPLELRLAVAAGCAAFVPGLRLAGVAVLSLLPIALNRAGPRGFTWLGAGDRRSSNSWIAVASLALAAIAVVLGAAQEALVAGGAAILAGLTLEVPWLALAAFGCWLFAGTAPPLRHLDWRWTEAVAGVATAGSLLSHVAWVRRSAGRIARWIRPRVVATQAPPVAAPTPVLSALRRKPEAGPRDWTLALELSALLCVGVAWLLALPGASGLRALPMALCALALLALAGWATTFPWALLFALWTGWLLPPGFFAVGLSAAAVACLGLSFLRTQSALLDAAVVFATVALLWTPSLGSAELPWKLGAALLILWERARRDEAWRDFAWVGTWVLLHTALLHVGAVLSTGRPPQHVLPYATAVSAGMAVLALFLAGGARRARLGRVFAVLALLEAAGGWGWISGREPVEGALLGLSLAALAVALLVFAVRERDAAAGYLAEAALFLGYLGVRSLALGGTFGAGDALASIAGGAVLGGLAGWAHRQASSAEALAGPARLGAYLVPLAGLFALPWGEPLVAAALLVGNAAHFAALARGEGERRIASLVSAVAFNGALLLAWSADRGLSAELFLIPAGVSLLMLVRVFREELSPDVEAKLRAVAVTGIYASAAFRPLMFPQTWAFLSCVALCLLGVGVGIALRIRSYVYLGTAFLVTCVVSNLVRFGVRDHRAGAAFLSALGLLVVGSMILLSAKRAELLRRYEALRERLAEWQA